MAAGVATFDDVLSTCRTIAVNACKILGAPQTPTFVSAASRRALERVRDDEVGADDLLLVARYGRRRFEESTGTRREQFLDLLTLWSAAAFPVLLAGARVDEEKAEARRLRAEAVPSNPAPRVDPRTAAADRAAADRRRRNEAHEAGVAAKRVDAMAASWGPEGVGALSRMPRPGPAKYFRDGTTIAGYRIVIGS